MTTETNKAIVRRFLDQVMNNHRHDLAEEFLADTAKFYGPGPTLDGLTAITEWFDTHATAFPDWRDTITDMVAEGDKVVVRVNSQATHLGEMTGIPATGKPVTLDAIVIYRLTNGKIDEARLAMDNLSFMQQLGVIPAPQAA